MTALIALALALQAVPLPAGAATRTDVPAASGLVAITPDTSVPEASSPDTSVPESIPQDTSAPQTVAPPADAWLAEDKLQHFAMSFAAAAFTYGAARTALGPEPARAAAAGVAITLGLGKEIADVRRGSFFSLKDLVWDAAGVGLGLFFVTYIR